MDEKQVAILRQQIEREKPEHYNAMTANKRFAETVYGSGDANFLERFIQAEVNKLLPFAVEISERDNVVGELTSDQYEEAGKLCAKASLNSTICHIEKHVEDQAFTPQHQQLMERLLAMTKKHQKQMNEASDNSGNLSEDSLWKLAQSMSEDIRRLSDDQTE